MSSFYFNFFYLFAACLMYYYCIYRGDPNTRLIWFLNAKTRTGWQMVQLSNTIWILGKVSGIPIAKWSSTIWIWDSVHFFMTLLKNRTKNGQINVTSISNISYYILVILPLVGQPPPHPYTHNTVDNRSALLLIIILDTKSPYFECAVFGSPLYCFGYFQQY